MIYLQQELGRAWVCLPLGISLGLRPREIPRGRQTQALPRSCWRYIPFSLILSYGLHAFFINLLVHKQKNVHAFLLKTTNLFNFSLIGKANPCLPSLRGKENSCSPSQRGKENPCLPSLRGRAWVCFPLQQGKA